MDTKQETSSFNHILMFDISQDRTFESFKDGFKKKMGQSKKVMFFFKGMFLFFKNPFQYKTTRSCMQHNF